jgi:hypothetical protein
LLFYELQGNRNEFKFLTFIAENAQQLEVMFIELKNGPSYIARVAMATELMALRSANWDSRDCKLLFRTSKFPGGGRVWSFEMGTFFLEERPPDPAYIESTHESQNKFYKGTPFTLPGQRR